MDFRQLVNRLPKGSSFTILSDSCHSGCLIDKKKEQIGPSTVSSLGLRDGDGTAPFIPKAKSIPFDSLLHFLSTLTKINTSDIGTHLLQCFGADASLRFRMPREELDAPIDPPLKPDEGILLSGCQANKTCVDVNPWSSAASAGGGGGAGKAYGAFSNAVQTVLRENPRRRRRWWRPRGPCWRPKASPSTLASTAATRTPTHPSYGSPRLLTCK
ncbi:hypothetical protein SAY87_031390 [Trapa incisa]|uniref:Uncharacterized protein n=1 Tax=Trapa incisa TaxID=236973 RepID=A0AAN7KUX9_9MYRT|nr:hypothetical protein SAY87_031390 [Trapa incisa]